jgi:membrane associated rhomboid family serine protease
MNETDQRHADELQAVLQSLRRRMRALTVAVLLMTLALLLTVAAVFGQLVNWFAGDVLLQGGVAVGAALLGFFFGWIARRA